MSEFLSNYHPVHPTTWVYLSSLLLIGVFFKFGRFWSVRNVDLVLLILLAPGLLVVHAGEASQRRKLSTARAAEAVLPENRRDEAADVTESESGGAVLDETVGEDDRLRAAAPQNPPSGAPAEVVGAVPPDNPSAPSGTGPDGTASNDIAPADIGSDEPLDAELGDSAAASALETVTALDEDQAHMHYGYLFLLIILMVFLVRLLLDSTMVRRPLLEPNLSTGGLAFIGCSLFVFLMANVIISHPLSDDSPGAGGSDPQTVATAHRSADGKSQRGGPGHALLHSIPRLVTTPLDWEGATESEIPFAKAAKVIAILSHLAIVLGLVAIGYQHFSNIKTGIGVATLYLMMPYTAVMTGMTDHVVPAAFLVWAVLSYRRPFAAGLLIGLAGGAAYYPLYLLPLWLSFYWQRGLMRFIAGFIVTLLLAVAALLLASSELTDFWPNAQKMFALWLPQTPSPFSIWGLGWDPRWRFPVWAAFLGISGAFCLWPAQKNLGTLLSCSAAVMVATQFWHGYGGGLYMAWFLPLTLLTVFRPNLEDRVALSVLGEGWFGRGKPPLRRVDRAA